MPPILFSAADAGVIARGSSAGWQKRAPSYRAARRCVGRPRAGQGRSGRHRAVRGYACWRRPSVPPSARVDIGLRMIKFSVLEGARSRAAAPGRPARPRRDLALPVGARGVRPRPRARRDRAGPGTARWPEAVGVVLGTASGAVPSACSRTTRRTADEFELITLKDDDRGGLAGRRLPGRRWTPSWSSSPSRCLSGCASRPPQCCAEGRPGRGHGGHPALSHRAATVVWFGAIVAASAASVPGAVDQEPSCSRWPVPAHCPAPAARSPRSPSTRS